MNWIGVDPRVSGSVNTPMPGDSTTVPKYWGIPHLRIGALVKVGFKEFVEVKPNVTGFSIAVFRASVHRLGFKIDCDFVPYINDKNEMAGTYDELLQGVNEKV